jgi:integrase/recombinase XerC
MNDSAHHAPATATIEAARLLLEKVGVNLADLLATPAERSDVPVFEDYIPKLSDAVSDGTRRVYASYWSRVLQAWPRRRITEPTPSEISQLAEQVKATAVKRSNARGGRGAAEHLIAALRCLYNYAVADGILTEAENPAARVPKPRRLRSARMALPDHRLNELSQVTASTGNDPALDTLLLRLHMETACRRGGALALQPCDLDPGQCLIRLHEKGETVRWQPVSPTLMAHLIAHGQSRGGLGSGQRLLRYATGRPISARRYDYLWERLGEHLPWVKTQQVSMHWIRHHPDLGRTPVRLRGRPSLRRPRRPRPGSKIHGRHGHLRPRRATRSGNSPRRPDRRTAPAGDHALGHSGREPRRGQAKLS